MRYSVDASDSNNIGGYMLRYKLAGNGPINSEILPSSAGEIDSLRLTLSGTSGTSETLLVKLLSASGSAFNITLHSQDINSLSYHVWQPTRPHPFFAGDVIAVTWSNTNDVSWGLEVIYR
jgi:hypothetical protein